jgi:salicylate hydroxylase
MAYANYANAVIQGALPMSPGPILERPHRVARSELLDILRKDLPPASLHTAKRLRSLERSSSDGTYSLRFEDGTVAHADLVVGADGIHSTCRSHLQRTLGRDLDEPIYSGQTVYRALIPRSAFLDDLEVHDILFGDGHRSINFRGPGKHFLFFAVGHGGKHGNVVAFIPEERELSESWSAKGKISELQRELEGWCKPVRRVVEEMGKISSECLKQALYYRKSLDKWTDGTLVLLGDAAHPILPHQGQGTAMAIGASRLPSSSILFCGFSLMSLAEDGVALAMLLKGATRATLAERLNAFVRLRKPRTDRMLQTSIAMGKVSSSATLTEHEKSMMTDRSWIWYGSFNLSVSEVQPQPDTG